MGFEVSARQHASTDHQDTSLLISKCMLGRVVDLEGQAGAAEMGERALAAVDINSSMWQQFSSVFKDDRGSCRMQISGGSVVVEFLTVSHIIPLIVTTGNTGLSMEGPDTKASASWK